MITTLQTPIMRAIKRSSGQSLGTWHLTDYNAMNCIQNLFNRITDDALSKGVVILGFFKLPDKIFRKFGMSGIIIDIPTKYSYLIASENEEGYPFFLDYLKSDPSTNITRFIVKEKKSA